MSKNAILFLVIGVVAIVYGLLLLWSAAQSGREMGQQAWLKSEEVAKSRFNSLHNMRYLLRPERQNISFSKSKARGYAMLAIGIAFLVMAFT